MTQILGKDQLCQYGNCEETKVRARVSYNGERLAFCSAHHAGLWLLRTDYPRAAVVLNPVKESAQ